MADGDTPLRADAKRNYDRLLEAARDAFAEQGTEASLRDVARRAGVGIGTLYRHFPTREALLETLLRDAFENLGALTGELAAAQPPADALCAWLLRFAAGQSAYRGLPESVLAALHDGSSQLHSACASMRAAATDLLTAAQRAGTVRDDIGINDLLALTAGIAWAAEQSPATDHDLNQRLLGLVMRGARTPA